MLATRISQLRILVAGLIVVLVMPAAAWAAPAHGATRASGPGVSVKGGMLVDVSAAARRRAGRDKAVQEAARSIS